MSEATKTYYLLKAGTGFIRESGIGFASRVETFSATREDATRFPSVNAVLTFITKATRTHNEEAISRRGVLGFLSDAFNILRVDVTPAQQTVAAANDIDGLIDGKRPVALYNVRKQLYVRYDSAGYLTYDTIEKAHVFADLAAVLKFNFPRTSVGLPEDIEVHQVVAHTIPEKVTETILK